MAFRASASSAAGNVTVPRAIPRAGHAAEKAISRSVGGHSQYVDRQNFPLLPPDRGASRGSASGAGPCFVLVGGSTVALDPTVGQVTPNTRRCGVCVRSPLIVRCSSSRSAVPRVILGPNRTKNVVSTPDEYSITFPTEMTTSSERATIRSTGTRPGISSFGGSRGSAPFGTPVLTVAIAIRSSPLSPNPRSASESYCPPLINRWEGLRSPQPLRRRSSHKSDCRVRAAIRGAASLRGDEVRPAAKSG